MRIKGVVSYDGSHYYGFQVQKKENEITIQEKIQNSLSKIFNKEIKIFASGRTDKGVHALNQVFHFDIDEEKDLDKLLYSLNCLLPDDIYVKSLTYVSDEFHSRYSATKKHYRYIIDRVRNPLNVNYSLFYNKNIDFDLLDKGINLFLGTHDFINFCSNKEHSYFRTIYSFTYVLKDNQLIFDIIGSGFKRYMVRMIIGSLLALTSGKINLDYISDRLNRIIDETTIFNADSKGLYLVEVFYD